jgi:hypothetical protein
MVAFRPIEASKDAVCYVRLTYKPDPVGAGSALKGEVLPRSRQQARSTGDRLGDAFGFATSITGTRISYKLHARNYAFPEGRYLG